MNFAHHPLCGHAGGGLLPGLLLGLLMTAAAQAADPGALRDPMRAPPQVRAAGTPTPAEALPAPASPRHVMVVGGQRYVVDGARRRAVGDMLGNARIESIEDSAVVVRQAGVQHRLPLFTGVVKRPSVPTTDSATAAPPKTANPTPKRTGDRP